MFPGLEITSYKEWLNKRFCGASEAEGWPDGNKMMRGINRVNRVFFPEWKCHILGFGWDVKS